MKPLTELQAWELLARLFSMKRPPHTGLCHATFRGEIPCVVGIRMRLKILAYKRRRKFGAYFWPHTAGGNKQRVAFCRRQIAALRKKGAKRNPIMKGN